MKSRWNETHIVTTYELARSGCSQEQIARSLNVTPMTFHNWKKEHPGLRKALRRGFLSRRGNHQNKWTFRDVVEERLPPELKSVWDRINKYEKLKGGVAKIEAMLERSGKRFRQYLFIHALMMSNFNISKARQKVNVPMHTYRRWLETDPGFAALVDEVEQCKKDFFEDCLIQLVEDLDGPTVRMVNERYNADRGYGEKIKQEVEAYTRHEHVLNVDALDLSIGEKRALLQKIRKAKQIESTVVDGR